MNQAITGVSPAETTEVTIMTVFPSIGARPIGQFLGQLYSIKVGTGAILNLGNLIALLSIPLAIPLFFFNIFPGLWFIPPVLRRYRLTNRRVVVELGFSAQPERWVDLNNFDSIETVTLPGQAWYPCGDLLFRKGQVETLRLSGVPHPEGFRHTCLKAQRAHVGVNRAVGR